MPGPGYNLARQFMLGSLVVMLLGSGVLGWWVGREIEAGVIHRTAAANGLYVENFLEPLLSDLRLEPGQPLPPERIAPLEQLLSNSAFSKQVVQFKVWGRRGLVLYSTNPAQVGRRFEVSDDLRNAWRGQVSADITLLDKPENLDDPKTWGRLLESYIPIRQRGSDQIVLVGEFYTRTDELEASIRMARLRSWGVVGAVTLATYLLLLGIVRRGSNTIRQQQAALSEQLDQNRRMAERVRRAASRTAALNERFLRRLSSDLHDGPAQELSFALLRTDAVAARLGQLEPSARDGLGRELEAVEGSLKRALDEMRSITADLRLPELDRLSPDETVRRAVREHQRRTGSEVALEFGNNLPPQAPLPVKIALFRLTQEALSNAARHAGARGQRVGLRAEGGLLELSVADSGPGFAWDDGTGSALAQEGHLGIVGMRERVESLGGSFGIETAPGRGTRVVAQLPLLQPSEPEPTEA